MNLRSRPHRLALAALVMAMAVIAIVVVTSFHHHDDGTFHPDCSLCRYILNGLAPPAAVENLLVAVAVLPEPLLAPRTVHVDWIRLLTVRLPHGPPAAV